MTWDVDVSRRAEMNAVGELLPDEVLYEFEGPCIFTTRTPTGALALAYLSAQLDVSNRFLVATTSDGTIEDLKKGLISVREALRRGSIWVVDTDLGNRPLEIFCTEWGQIPDEYLPQDGIMLLPSLQSAVVLRLTGTEILPGDVPSSVLARASDIASRGLKPIFEWAASAIRPSTGGRPPEWLRDLYSLRTQRVAFGSLELALNPAPVPAEIVQGSLWEEADLPSAREINISGWDALCRGLEWLATSDEYPGGDTEASAAILESLSRIAPVSTGPVTAVELSGRLVRRQPDRPFRIDRTSGKRIRKAIRALNLNQPQPVQFRMLSGFVRECDLDRGSFIVRGEGHIGDVPIYAENERLLEVALEALTEQAEVLVAVRTGETWTAVDILATTTKDHA